MDDQIFVHEDDISAACINIVLLFIYMCNKGLYLVYRLTVITLDDLIWYWPVIRIAHCHVTHMYIYHGASKSGVSHSLELTSVYHVERTSSGFLMLLRGDSTTTVKCLIIIILLIFYMCIVNVVI